MRTAVALLLLALAPVCFAEKYEPGPGCVPPTLASKRSRNKKQSPLLQANNLEIRQSTGSGRSPTGLGTSSVFVLARCHQ